jgi:hypothetical protein
MPHILDYDGGNHDENGELMPTAYTFVENYPVSIDDKNPMLDKNLMLDKLNYLWIFSCI